MTGDVVICTKDRPDDLRRCLRSIVAQTHPPDTVRIVDASSDARTAAVVDEFRADLHIWFVRSSPSTTRQRNRGIDSSTAPIVHFLDDDVELDPGYLGEIVDVFDRDKDLEVGGVGGLPTNQVQRRTSRLQRAILSRLRTPGRVLRSGRGILVYGADEELEVDWLSGCCMSFRTEIIRAERFDDRGHGYVVGEDLDVSYRIRQHHRLLVTPRARLVHHEAPRNRLSAATWAERDALARHARVATRIGDLRPWAFHLDLLLQIVVHAFRGLAAGPDAAHARGLALGYLRGALKIARQRRAGVRRVRQ